MKTFDFRISLWRINFKDQPPYSISLWHSPCISQFFASKIFCVWLCFFTCRFFPDRSSSRYQLCMRLRQGVFACVGFACLVEMHGTQINSTKCMATIDNFTSSHQHSQLNHPRVRALPGSHSCGTFLPWMSEPLHNFQITQHFYIVKIDRLYIHYLTMLCDFVSLHRKWSRQQCTFWWGQDLSTHGVCLSM